MYSFDKDGITCNEWLSHKSNIHNLVTLTWDLQNTEFFFHHKTLSLAGFL